jgi:ubiquinone/menaquinone biosynthesis C-methylase UbiE
MKPLIYFNKVAKDYEESLKSRKVSSRLGREMKLIFKRNKIKNGTILDVACGPGILSFYLGNKFTYTGIDLSSKMLDEAKARGYYKVHRGDMFKILKEFPSNSFDHVVNSSSLYYVHNAKAVWKEMVRVARISVTATLEDITDEFKQKTKVLPVYNHIDMKINNLIEDYTTYAWTSPGTGIKINARFVFKKKS